MICKEKAELTYAALQKRKMYKKKKAEYEFTSMHLNSVRRCKKRRHDRYLPGLKTCTSQS